MNFHISVSVIFASNLKANREIDKNYPGFLLKTSQEKKFNCKRLEWTRKVFNKKCFTIISEEKII